MSEWVLVDGAWVWFVVVVSSGGLILGWGLQWWVMVSGGNCGFVGLRRKKCDFVDDLGSKKRGREEGELVCVLVMGLFLFVILVVRVEVVGGGDGGCGCGCGYWRWCLMGVGVGMAVGF